MFRLFLSILAITVGIFTYESAHAQNNTALPELPDPIQNLVAEGAQIRYLGRHHNMDGWITIKNGQEQYFYVNPDGQSFVMGLMFDNSGKVVTIEQVKNLRKREGDVLDLLTDDFGANSQQKVSEAANRMEFKSPSEQLFYDIENSNWVPLGQQGAPILYSFVDPQCPHCHDMIEKMKSTYLDNGRVQMRIIPVGFREETRSQAAFLLATPNPQERWYKHLQGDENALPARSEINQQGVQRNLAIMQSWKLSVTPLSIYRAKDGSVKIIRGIPTDLNSLIEDLGSRV